MKSRHFLVPLICSVITLSACTFTARADSGLDFALTQLNAAARLNFGSYKATIGLSYNLSASKIEYKRLGLYRQATRD